MTNKKHPGISLKSTINIRYAVCVAPSGIDWPGNKDTVWHQLMVTDPAFQAFRRGPHWAIHYLRSHLDNQGN